MKKFIPFQLRRLLRRLQSKLRLSLQPILYQIWILKQQPLPTSDATISADFEVCLADGCTLAPHALTQVAALLEQHPETDLVYTDSDEINAFGLRCRPYFKPDWDPYLFLSQDYIQPFYVIRKTAKKNPQNVWHIPHILCHQKTVLKKSSAKPRPVFTLPEPAPLISIIIPTKDGLSLLKPCIESILNKSHFKNFEIIIVNNNSEAPDTLHYFKTIINAQIKVIDYPKPFNYSAINNFAVNAAQGEVLLFLNNDIEVISTHWLDEMLGLALQDNVGAVGAKLYYPNNTIQHAGIVLGIDGTSRHVLTGLKREASGYFNNLQTIHCCSAVTAACLMMRKAVFEQVGGFDETAFPITFNDVDLCLKVRQAGYYVAWTPYAELYHKESATRGEDLSAEKRARVLMEEGTFKEKWHDLYLARDPFYNPNLSLTSNDYAYVLQPRE